MASYTLNDTTVDILKNFASINSQVVFKEGRSQRACNDTRNCQKHFPEVVRSTN